MHFPALLLASLSSSALAATRFHVPEPARVRDEPTPSQCTSAALATVSTINRGNEGIWVVKANISDMHELYRFRQTDWLDNDHQQVLDTCSSICMEGNNTASPGTWLPASKYFEGAFVNTPGGNPPNHILWQCSCYDRPVTSDDLTPGGGVWNNANPGSGTIINRDC